jgi:hypothetical protein
MCGCSYDPYRYSSRYAAGFGVGFGVGYGLGYGAGLGYGPYDSYGLRSPYYGYGYPYRGLY